MKLSFSHKSVYGRGLFYPSCDKAKKLAAWKKRKAFEAEEICMLRELGFKITINGKSEEQQHDDEVTRREEERCAALQGSEFEEESPSKMFKRVTGKLGD